jgi:predicted RND superfamily exporter protein
VNRLLDLLARLAVATPRLTLAGLLVVTIGLGAAATTLEVDTGVESFAPEGGIAATLDAIEDRFGTASSVQLLVDAGPAGTVLDQQGLLAAERLGDALRDDPTVTAALAPARSGRPPVITWGLPFFTAIEATGEPLAELDDRTLELLVGAVLDSAGEQVEPLLASDLETDPPRARSGLVQIELDTSVPSTERAEASRRIDTLAGEVDTGDLRVSILSMTAIEDGIDRALQRDMPVLLGTSLLLVLGVLGWLFRSVSDVLVGFLGLIASIVWMAGLGALLGPNGVGLIGPMSQIAIAVPVLLVGLGIDYSVHLTSRYREQRALGDAPEQAATVALRTVGIALALATIASVAGFLANVATPLPPIRDFGILAAVGIVSAFLLLGAIVPATRTLLDRRPRAAGARGRAADRVGGPDPRWVQVTSALATRHIAPVIAVTVVALLAGAAAASRLSTEFDEQDFLPDGDPVVALIDRLDRQFGGDVGERTYVVVDGAPRDPELLAAVARFERDLPALDGVRTAGDRADLVSPYELVDRLGEQGVLVRDRIAAELDDWLDPAAAAEQLPLPETIDPDLLADEAGGMEIPGELLAALRPRLPTGRDATVALAATADPSEIEREVRAALAEDIAAERPAELDEATLRSLAGAPPSELTLDRLDVSGYPLDRLDGSDLEQLELLEALEPTGWRPEAGTLANPEGDVLRDQLAVVADREGDELARLLDDDGLLLILRTAGGADEAEALAADLQAAADPVVEAGGEVTVVSDPLMQAEIIASLSAAQLLAIMISLAAAAILLLTATLVSSRSAGLGLIGIVPSVVALVLVLGVMLPLGLAFNALTATVASIAVGIGVPYGIHLINRFREARDHGLHADDAIRDTLRNTGAALVGSAATTGLAFAVLLMSESTPIRQFGAVSTLMIGFALLACLLVQPALLVLWARRRDAIADAANDDEPADVAVNA